jgi:hypothetical protein
LLLTPVTEALELLVADPPAPAFPEAVVPPFPTFPPFPPATVSTATTRVFVPLLVAVAFPVAAAPLPPLPLAV